MRIHVRVHSRGSDSPGPAWCVQSVTSPSSAHSPASCLLCCYDSQQHNTTTTKQSHNNNNTTTQQTANSNGAGDNTTNKRRTTNHNDQQTTERTTTTTAHHSSRYKRVVTHSSTPNSVHYHFPSSRRFSIFDFSSNFPANYGIALWIDCCEARCQSSWLTR